MSNAILDTLKVNVCFKASHFSEEKAVSHDRFSLNGLNQGKLVLELRRSDSTEYLIFPGLHGNNWKRFRDISPIINVSYHHPSSVS